jgi:hypothetical protein
MRSDFPDSDSDLKYAALLKNKTVAVVGPAQTLLDKKRGRRIDSYDIVVRFNEFFDHIPYTSAPSDDVGARGDVFYCNQVILRDRIVKRGKAYHKGFVQGLSRMGTKYFVCTNNSLSYDKTGKPSTSCNKSDRGTISEFRQLLSKYETGIGLRVVHGASALLMQWLKGNWGRTGFVGVVDLLGFEISRMYITGMTFYHGGGHLLSPSSDVLHPLKNRDGSSTLSNTGQGHNSYLELDIMRQLVRTFRDRIDVDEDLSTLLQMNMCT